MANIKERPFISPNDKECLGENDTASIQNAIDLAESEGVRKIVIPRYNKRSDSFEWIIPSVIRIPSDMTVILDNCYMKMEDGVISQMFTNSLSYDEAGKTLNGEQSNITIMGEGNATIDGGLHNGLTEKNSGQFGLPIIWNNLLLYFHNVKNIKVENLTIKNQRWWAVCFMFCRYGKVSKINFGGMGNVPNQDGIDLRIGCHDFIIEDITGFTGDDTVALTALSGKSMEQKWTVLGKDADIYNVIIRDIKSDPFQCCVVRLLNHDGHKLYNILIEDIIDTSVPYSDVRPSCCVRIGENGRYSNLCQNAFGDTYNITVRNITTRARNAICVNASLSDAYFSNIKIHSDGLNAVGTHGGAVVERIMIDGVNYYIDQKSRDGQNEYGPDDYYGEVLKFENFRGKDIVVRDVFADKAKNLVLATGGIKANISGVYINSLSGDLVVSDKDSEITVTNVK